VTPDSDVFVPAEPSTGSTCRYCGDVRYYTKFYGPPHVPILVQLHELVLTIVPFVCHFAIRTHALGHGLHVEESLGVADIVGVSVLSMNFWLWYHY
jgi:hypothetical protein